jgi:Fe(II)/alpha-ketoglutarate-dependent arginine beta-hydroxylase
MKKVTVPAADVAAIQALVSELADRYSTTDHDEFLRRAGFYAQDLPRGLREAVYDYKLQEEEDGVFILSEYPIDQEKIGHTPKHWKWRPANPPTLHEEILLVLMGSLLGEVIGWATQQDGHVVHGVFPIQGHEHEQLGSGSEELLTWHTEDAFHPYRGDYLGLFCLRNPIGAATTVGRLDCSKLPPGCLDVLLQPRFIIRPDESHLPKNRSDLGGSAELLERAYRQIEKMNREPEKVPVLFGDPRSPYLCLDPYFMDRLDGDPEAQEALDEMIRVIDESLVDLVLQPGDLLLLDNYRAVHGRRPFKARYDGNDRWMVRVNISRDLRKSREVREHAWSRVLF